MIRLSFFLSCGAPQQEASTKNFPFEQKMIMENHAYNNCAALNSKFSLEDAAFGGDKSKTNSNRDGWNVRVELQSQLLHHFSSDVNTSEPPTLEKNPFNVVQLSLFAQLS